MRRLAAGRGPSRGGHGGKAALASKTPACYAIRSSTLPAVTIHVPPPRIASRRSPRRVAWALLLATAAATAAIDPKASRFYEDALTRYERNDMAGAVIQLKNALKIDRTMLPVQVLLGKALLANRDVVAAEVAFDDALRLGVNRAEVVVPLARAVAAQAKAQQIVEQPRFAVAGLPPGVQAQLLLIRAGAFSDLGDMRAALKAVEESRAIDGSSVDSWLAEVPIRIRARQLPEAMAAAERAVALSPASAEALYLRGTVLHTRGETKAALAAYDQALAAQAGHTEALVSRAGLLLDLGRRGDAARDVAKLLRGSPSEPRGRYLQALLAELDGNPTGVKAALNEITGLLDPVPIEFLRYRPQTLMLGGMAHYGLGQLEKARPYFEAVQRQQPQSAASKLLAQIYIGEKNIDRAIESLEAYLKGQPRDMQALQLLASAHMAQGRYARATQLMQDALRVQDAPSLHLTLGMSLLGGGKYVDAVAALETALRKDRSQVAAGTALTNIYLQSGQPAKALPVAEALLKQRPKDPGLLNLVGTARAATGNLAGARTAFEEATKADAAFTPPQINLARLEIDARAYDAAAARLTAVLRTEDRNIDAMLELARLHELRGQSADAQRWFEKADDHSSAGNFNAGIALIDFHLRHRRPDAAREASRRIAGKAPDAVPVLLTLARVALASGDTTGARANLSRAATAASYNPSVLVQIALLQLQAGHVAGAAYSADKALNERPDFLPALALMTDIDVRQGELVKAEQRARGIVAKQPRSGIGHALLGDIAMARKQLPAAVDHYRRAHQLDQSSESLLRLFGVLAGSDPPAALRVAEQWLKVNPRDAAVHRALGDAYARQNNLPAARASYLALLGLRPDDAEVLNNLANLQLLLGDVAAALKSADRALQLQPGTPHIIGTAGWAAFKAGQTDRSLQLLRDARLRDPNNPDTRYFLSSVLASVGRRNEAREELEVALRGGRDFASAKEAERLLATLK